MTFTNRFDNMDDDDDYKVDDECGSTRQPAVPIDVLVEEQRIEEGESAADKATTHDLNLTGTNENLRHPLRVRR